MDLFSDLPTGDLWEDAGMPELFQYLYHCKHVRRGIFQYYMVTFAGTPSKRLTYTPEGFQLSGKSPLLFFTMKSSLG